MEGNSGTSRREPFSKGPFCPTPRENKMFVVISAGSTQSFEEMVRTLSKQEDLRKEKRQGIPKGRTQKTMNCYAVVFCSFPGKFTMRWPLPERKHAMYTARKSCPHVGGWCVFGLPQSWGSLHGLTWGLNHILV